jgi:hypothetical protein
MRSKNYVRMEITASTTIQGEMYNACMALKKRVNFITLCIVFPGKNLRSLVALIEWKLAFLLMNFSWLIETDMSLIYKCSLTIITKFICS